MTLFVAWLGLVIGFRAERVYEVGNQWPGDYEDDQEHGRDEDDEPRAGLVVLLVQGVDGEQFAIASGGNDGDAEGEHQRQTECDEQAEHGCHYGHVTTAALLGFSEENGHGSAPLKSSRSGNTARKVIQIL